MLRCTREKVPIVFQNLQIYLAVQSVGGIDFGNVKILVFNGVVLESHVHWNGSFEIQTIKIRERSVLHTAFQCKELLLRAEGQLVRHRNQVTDGLKVILNRNLLRYCDCVGIVKAQFFQKTHIKPFHCQRVCKVVDRLSCRHIGGILFK